MQLTHFVFCITFFWPLALRLSTRDHSASFGSVTGLTFGFLCCGDDWAALSWDRFITERERREGESSRIGPSPPRRK